MTGIWNAVFSGAALLGRTDCFIYFSIKKHGGKGNRRHFPALNIKTAFLIAFLLPLCRFCDIIY